MVVDGGEGVMQLQALRMSMWSHLSIRPTSGTRFFEEPGENLQHAGGIVHLHVNSGKYRDYVCMCMEVCVFISTVEQLFSLLLGFGTSWYMLNHKL